ncbi:MAG TPA: methyltransferase, partial [Acetobacteraceae bacterium]|nr:methyltransferase [Acetobacteraceae bacterium]
DRSERAAGVAKARLAARGLDNVDFVRASLLDLPRSGLGPFDYVDCCGVLHHLPDPAAGLASLEAVLAPGGGMGLMLYAPHGRTGVYMLQDALRTLAPETEPPAARLDIAKRVMRHLPESAWLRFNRSFSDHLDGGDAGLYDLLLNPRDRAFDIPALDALLSGTGLRITCLIEPIRYDPAIYLPDPKLRTLAAALSPTQRAALAEQLTGNIGTHVLYCVRAAEWQPPADPFAPDAVPISREVLAEELARNIRPDGTMAFFFDGLRVPLPMPKLAMPVMSLIDGARSVGAIMAALRERGIPEAQAARGWREVWETFSALNRVLLTPPA